MIARADRAGKANAYCPEWDWPRTQAVMADEEDAEACTPEGERPTPGA